MNARGSLWIGSAVAVSTVVGVAIGLGLSGTAVLGDRVGQPLADSVIALPSASPTTTPKQLASPKPTPTHAPKSAAPETVTAPAAEDLAAAAVPDVAPKKTSPVRDGATRRAGDARDKGPASGPHRLQAPGRHHTAKKPPEADRAAEIARQAAKKAGKDVSQWLDDLNDGQWSSVRDAYWTARAHSGVDDDR